MKPIPLRLSALLAAVALTNNLPAQDNASQILTRGHVAALQVNQAESQQEPGSGFPAFAPGRTGRDTNEDSAKAGSSELVGPAITMGSSLVVVLGLFAGLVWMTRKFGSRGVSGGAIPKEVLQSLGSSPIDPRTSITLVRCGNRILVIASAATGTRKLAEITDPEEVRQMSAACLGDSKQAFASALRSIEQEKTEPSYVGTPTSPRKQRAPGRLFASA